MSQLHADKVRLLRRYKWIATLLLVLVAAMYILSITLLNAYSWSPWLKAFSEAAMVGGIADWFAVVALFKHPLGLPIPHTSLIQKNKNSIAQNLGGFISDNFFSKQETAIKIAEFKILSKLIDWLSQPDNRLKISHLVRQFLQYLLSSIDTKLISQYIQEMVDKAIDNIEWNRLTIRILEGLQQSDLPTEWLQTVSVKIEQYLERQTDYVEQLVSKETGKWIPGFIDKAVARKIVKGLVHLMQDIRKDPEHPLNVELRTAIAQYTAQLKSGEKSVLPIVQKGRNSIFQDKDWQMMGEKILTKSKTWLLDDLNSGEASKVHEILLRVIEQWVSNFKMEGDKLAEWEGHFNRFLVNLIEKYKGQVSIWIEHTVEQWDAKELSQKLELEVGKDLQFIRLNGTLVGGVIGIIIYALTYLISQI